MPMFDIQIYCNKVLLISLLKYFFTNSIELNDY